MANMYSMHRLSKLAVAALIPMCFMVSVIGNYIAFHGWNGHLDWATLTASGVVSVIAMIVLPASVLLLGRIYLNPIGSAADSYCCTMNQGGVDEGLFLLALAGPGVLFSLSIILACLLFIKKWKFYQVFPVASAASIPLYIAASWNLESYLDDFRRDVCPTIHCGG